MNDLNVLAHDLTEAGALIGARAVEVIEQSAQRVEDQAKVWAPRKRLEHYAETITHDLEVDAGVIAAEIGPDKTINGQARLAHIFEYGTATLAPRAHLGPALDLEAPKLTAELEHIAGSVL